MLGSLDQINCHLPSNFVHSRLRLLQFPLGDRLAAFALAAFLAVAALAADARVAAWKDPSRPKNLSNQANPTIQGDCCLGEAAFEESVHPHARLSLARGDEIGRAHV